MEKLFLIDGNHLVHRSFHAIKPLYTRLGEQTNAIFGFFSILLNLIEKEHPHYLAVAFDEKAPTFRHIEHQAYKATRTKAPDELYTQIPKIKEILKAFQIPYYSESGFEADDLLGTFAHQAIQKNVQALIITGDHDALQLIEDDRILVIFPHKGYREPIIFNEAKVMEKFGITPKQMIDYKGLCGDNSDNLKGVQGIGPKGAQKLLQAFGSLENIYQNLDQVSEREREKLLNDKETAFTCKRLAQIINDVPVNLNLEECLVHGFDQPTLENVLEKYELFTIKRRIHQVFKTNPVKLASIQTTEQMRLF